MQRCDYPLTATRVVTRFTPAIIRLTAQTIDLLGPIDKSPQAETLKQLKTASTGKGLSVDDLVSIRKEAGGK